MSKIDALTRQLVGNRRTRRRKRFVYDVTVRSETGERIFRGKTTNLSRAGARLEGFPDGDGPTAGQDVLIEFLVVPKDLSLTSKVVARPARIWRIEGGEGAFSLAVKFDREFAE
jgi:hypothetical protein